MLEWLATGEDREFHRMLCLGLMVVFVTCVFGASTVGSLRLAYGRYNSDMKGPKVNGRWDWYGHGTSVAVQVPLWLYGSAACKGSWVNLVLLALFVAHYVNRSFIFGVKIRAPKPIPVGTLLSTSSFCLINGYIQGRHLTAFQAYPAEWAHTPQFVIGVALFCVGAGMNIQSDEILRSLRKPGETGYKIPRGGMFDYVSGANFLGEIVEWIGFALATWSLPGLTFAVTTICSIAPRAHHHHKWYLQKFPDYPKSRRAIIPFLL